MCSLNWQVTNHVRKKINDPNHWKKVPVDFAKKLLLGLRVNVNVFDALNRFVGDMFNDCACLLLSFVQCSMVSWPFSVVFNTPAGYRTNLEYVGVKEIRS